MAPLHDHLLTMAQFKEWKENIAQIFARNEW